MSLMSDVVTGELDSTSARRPLCRPMQWLTSIYSVGVDFRYYVRSLDSQRAASVTKCALLTSITLCRYR